MDFEWDINQNEELGSHFLSNSKRKMDNFSRKRTFSDSTDEGLSSLELDSPSKVRNTESLEGELLIFGF